MILTKKKNISKKKSRKQISKSRKNVSKSKKIMRGGSDQKYRGPDNSGSFKSKVKRFKSMVKRVFKPEPIYATPKNATPKKKFLSGFIKPSEQKKTEAPPIPKSPRPISPYAELPITKENFYGIPPQKTESPYAVGKEDIVGTHPGNKEKNLSNTPPIIKEKSKNLKKKNRPRKISRKFYC